MTLGTRRRRMMMGRRRRQWATPQAAALLAVATAVALASWGPRPAAAYMDAFLPAWSHEQVDMAEAKAAFLARFGKDYGYQGLIDKIRAKDMPHIAPTDVYLDWTGSALYRASQVDAMAADLKTHLYGNTHSHNPSSLLTERRVEEVRERVVKFFNTTLSEYSVIFTSGATAALHLLSETFPWSNSSRFTYLEQSHNSVLGIREFCLQHGGDFCALKEAEVDPEHPEATLCTACGRKDTERAAAAAAGADVLDDGVDAIMPSSSSSSGSGSGSNLRSSSGNGGASGRTKPPYHLFAFPAEDNFSGVKYSLDWIDRIQKSCNVCGKQGDWRVLLDAAAFVPTNRLDLGRYKPDFVTVSFYKMFGMPTGLGCLLVHKRSADILRKVFWGGGSVVVASPTQPITIFKMNPCAKFEDGTLSFLSIIGLNPGFDSFAELGIDRIQRHVWGLTRWAYEQLSGLRHANGRPVVRVYGKHAQKDKRVQGGIVSLNLLRPDRTFVGFHHIQHLATKHGFHIRSGCACNPGACFGYLGLSYKDINNFFLNKDSCGDGLDVANGGTLPLGAVRISFGSLTTFEDVQAFIEFVRAYYVDSGPMSALGVLAAPRGPPAAAEAEVGVGGYPVFGSMGEQGAAAVVA